MEYILTAAEMKKCDETASLTYGIPSLVLMERAALETVRVILDKYGSDIYVGVVAGCGNNGGDGVAIARILREYGVGAEIHLIGDVKKCSPETRQQLDIAKSLGIPVHFGLDNTIYDVLIDAIFGIGLTRAVEGVYRNAIMAMNESRARIVAVDMPSGINSDDGSVMGVAVKAELTVTYAYRKLGQVLYPGTQYAGEVICVPIGIPQEAHGERKNSIMTFNRQDLKLPSRNPAGNKGSFGKVLLVAGSKNMGGACQLAALSAFRIGAGMVRVFTAEENRESLLRKVPEVIVNTYRDDGGSVLTAEEESVLQEGLKWADIIAVGPGISTSAKAVFLVEYIMQNNQKPMIMDADALNILAEKQELIQQLEVGHREQNQEIVLTPHLGELARMIKYPVAQLQKDVIGYCKSFAKKYCATLVCKDARTFVAKRYKMTYVNTSGNDGMATAGSGDVLTGIIAGLMAQGMTGFDAAVMGTYIHGLAGDYAKEKTSAYYIMAQDIIDSLRYI